MVAGIALGRAAQQHSPRFLQVEQLSAERVFVHDADAGPSGSRVSLYPGSIVVSGQSEHNTWLMPGALRMNASGKDFAVSLALSKSDSGLLTLSDQNGRKLIRMGQVDGDAHGMITVHDP